MRRRRHQVGDQIFHLIGGQLLGDPDRHHGCFRHRHGFDICVRQLCDGAFFIAQQKLIAVRLEDTGEHAPVVERDHMADVIGVDSETRVRHIAHHRRIVTMHEIHQIRANSCSPTADGMTLEATRRFAAEHLASASPTPAFQFSKLQGLSQRRRIMLRAHVNPGQNESMQWHRSRSSVFIGLHRDPEFRNGAASRLNRDDHIDRISDVRRSSECRQLPFHIGLITDNGNLGHRLIRIRGSAGLDNNSMVAGKRDDRFFCRPLVVNAGSRLNRRTQDIVQIQL